MRHFDMFKQIIEACQVSNHILHFVFHDACYDFSYQIAVFAVYYVSIALWLFTPEAVFEFESRLILNFSQSVTFDTQHKNPLYTYIPYYIP